LENGKFVDQKFRSVTELIESRPDIFSRQGSVVESWRRYGGRRLGPYFRLSFRDGKKQRSVYLGRSITLAEDVRKILTAKQQPIHLARQCRRARVAVATALRRHKSRWEADLQEYGLESKGFEIRGWRSGSGLSAASANVSAGEFIKEGDKDENDLY
jgi:hypothetical protein